MGKLSRPRKGSLQFAPRKRAAKLVSPVNWSRVPSTSEPALQGLITYKVGMGTAIAKDTTEKSMTQNKRIPVPVTILEVPSMKVLSIRFYKNKKPVKDVLVSTDKELKKKLKVPKSLPALDKSIPEDYDDLHVLLYSLTKQTAIKKTPDILEVAISGDSKESKLEYAKSLVNKELSISDFERSIPESKLLDVRGVTKGKGTQGPVKRFGIVLRHHKSEKGVRKVGSIAPWHPARVTFRTPMAGQLGLFTRISYNHKVLSSGKISESDINPEKGFKNYGKIKTSYIIVKGSVPGPAKRTVVLTPALRPTKYRAKRSLEFVEVKH